MKHYDFTRKFSAAYDKAVDLYARGQRGAGTYFSPEETAWLAANGLAPQHLYDYAEDQNNAEEPGYDQALGIELIRRDYFLNVQGSRPSAVVLDETALPPKSEQVQNIEWLPRLIPKAKAKLRGELPPSLMYCCGGDRKFFKAHDILPAEFLSLVWRHEREDLAIIAWVIDRFRAGA
jgi:hypothetical protein